MDSSIDLTPYREQYSYYAKKLLSDLGLGDLPQPRRGLILVAIENYVQQILLNTILENLDETSLDKADRLIEEGVEPQDAVARVMLSMPDMDLKIADALAACYAQMVDEARQLSVALTKSSNK